MEHDRCVTYNFYKAYSSKKEKENTWVWVTW